MGDRYGWYGVTVVLATAVAMFILCLMSGCADDAVASGAVISSGASAAWPSESLDGLIGEPSFSTTPSSVIDGGNYVMVAYDDIDGRELSDYVDMLEDDSSLFVVYDEREPVVSCSLTDRDGNSITISQVDVPMEKGHEMASITVVRI